MKRHHHGITICEAAGYRATARVATGQARRLHNGVSMLHEPD